MKATKRVREMQSDIRDLQQRVCTLEKLVGVRRYSSMGLIFRLEDNLTTADSVFSSHSIAQHISLLMKRFGFKIETPDSSPILKKL